MHKKLSYMSRFIDHKRAVQGLTQCKLAEMSNISRATFIKIENGTNSPSFETISNIIDALDSSFTEFEEYISYMSIEHMIENFEMSAQDKAIILKNFLEL